MDRQQLLSLKSAEISDVSSYLGLDDGKVWGLELRKMGPTNSHKDLMIASIAKTYDLTLITRNKKDFEHMDIKVEVW